jgi:hypothetical protein
MLVIITEAVCIASRNDGPAQDKARLAHPPEPTRVMKISTSKEDDFVLEMGWISNV